MTTTNTAMSRQQLPTIRLKTLFCCLIAVVCLLASTPARAACTTPAGVAGDQFYNTTYSVMQFCNGTYWINMGAGAGLPACANNEIPRYNTSNAEWQCSTLTGDNLGAGGSTTGSITINNGSPTITLQDTDHRTGFIHMNSNLLYFVTGNVNGTSWVQNGGHWPLYINMGNDEVVVGGSLILKEGNLSLGTQGITSSAGTVIDGSGGWHRTYGDTGWYNGTYGGGWYMIDTTWVRAYDLLPVFPPVIS